LNYPSVRLILNTKLLNLSDLFYFTNYFWKDRGRHRHPKNNGIVQKPKKIWTKSIYVQSISQIFGDIADLEVDNFFDRNVIFFI